MQLSPSPALSGLVKHYLVIENQAANGGNHRFFPDGHPGLVFSYADSFTQSNTNQPDTTLPNSFVYGQIDRYHNLISGKKIGMLIVVLQPWGLYALSGVPGAATTNFLVDVSDVFGNEGKQLEDQVRTKPNSIDRIRQIERFLLSRWQTATHELASVQAAIQFVCQSQGAATVQALTQHLNMTERSLERRFDKIVGLKPKQFSRIVRLQSCLKMHRTNTAFSLTQLAYSAGYYDQAHFIREFTHLVGITPKQYSANTQRLAVNLMPLTTYPG